MTSPTSDRRQGLVGNTPIKAPVACATTGNIALSGEQVVDGFQTAGSRVLVKNQTDGITCGLYDSNSGPWTRCDDADGNYDLTTGTLVYVIGGVSQGGVFYQVTTTSPITIGTSVLSFSRSTVPSAASLVSVRDFGGILNGITDDSSAVAQANARALEIGGEIYFGGVANIASPTTITAPIVDTLAQIFSLTSQVTIANGLPVRPEWWGIGNQNVVDLAINSLPAAGGVVQFESRTYLTSSYAYGFAGSGKNISKANLKLQGRKMPTLASDCKSLTGGTILQGMVTVFADNVEISDLGVDVGFTFTAAFLGGASNAGFCDALTLTYPNDAVKAANGLKNRAILRNVIGLCCAPTSPSHAILVEGYKNVSLQGETIGCYGVHGTAIKSLDVKADTISTYCNGTDGLIIKSDSQTTAIAGDIQIGKAYINANGPPGLAPYLVATTGIGFLVQASSNNIGRVQIGSVDSFGYPTGCGVQFGGNFTIDDIEIGQLCTDQIGVGSTVAALDLSAAASQNIARWHIGSATLRNCGLAANFNFTQAANNPNHVSIGQLEVITASDVAAQVAGSSWVDIGSLIATSCTAGVYRMLGTPRLQVGMLTQAGTTPGSTYTNSSGGLQPALANSWAQVAANDPFSVDLTGGRVCLRGLVVPGTTNVISILPVWARPATNKRFMVQGYNGATVVSVPLVVDTAGNVKVNEIAGGTANCSTWLSLSGVTFDQQA